MILYRSLTEGLVEILVRSSLRGPCMRSLQMSCLRGTCMKALVGASWELLVSRSCKVRSSSSRSFYDDLASYRVPGMKILLKVFYNSLCEEAFAWSCPGPCEKLLERSLWNPFGVLTWSGPDSCEKILWRSCWNPPQEVLAWRSWRSSASVACILSDALGKFLYEDLLSSSL